MSLQEIAKQMQEEEEQRIRRESRGQDSEGTVCVLLPVYLRSIITPNTLKSKLKQQLAWNDFDWIVYGYMKVCGGLWLLSGFIIIIMYLLLSMN